MVCGTRRFSAWSGVAHHGPSPPVWLVMPIVLKRMGVDPAVAAGPFVTTARYHRDCHLPPLATIFLEQIR